MGKRLWDLAKSRFEIGTFLLAHRHKVKGRAVVPAPAEVGPRNSWKRLAWLGRRVPADASAEPCQTSGSGGVGTTGAPLGQPTCARSRSLGEQL